ncbi:MAG TPA: FAD-binding oxidoreductase [Niastella sp.]|nr:FAD-binding oxidoreductase [Niastella sp.]
MTWKISWQHSTYAIRSEPATAGHHWYRNALIWETARPYLYLRTTDDNRIVIDVKDNDLSDPRKRDKALPGKAKALERAFENLFPNIHFKTDLKWTGTFASTKDGFPYIGSLAGKPHTCFAHGFGGNSITFSVLAAQIITRTALGLQDDETQLFGFNR